MKTDKDKQMSDERPLEFVIEDIKDYIREWEPEEDRSEKGEWLVRLLAEHDRLKQENANINGELSVAKLNVSAQQKCIEHLEAEVERLTKPCNDYSWTKCQTCCPRFPKPDQPKPPITPYVEYEEPDQPKPSEDKDGE